MLRREHRHRRIAMATGGGRRTTTRTASALGLLHYFNVVVTREDVDRGKPAPDIFLTAAHRLGVQPAECLVYDDSGEGLEAAHVAGMDAVDIRGVRSTPP